MFKRALTILFFLTMPFIGGCTGPSPAEIGETELMISLGIVILSCPIVVVLTLLTKRLNLIRSIRFRIQYLIFSVVSLVLMYFLWGELGELIFSILGIPYLVFSTMVLLLTLPRRFLVYLPSFVLVPHFLMSGLLYATDSGFLLSLQPILFVVALWYVTMPASVIIFVVLLSQKRQATSQGISQQEQVSRDEMSRDK